MGNEIKPVNSPPPIDHSIQNLEQNHSDVNASSQANQDQAHQTSEAQQTQDAQLRKAGLQALGNQSSLPSLSQDFLNIMDSIVKEGYQTARPSEGGKAGDQGFDKNASSQKGAGQQLQKETQVIREFLKEAAHYLQKQNMDLSQMLNMIKVEQGGAFWGKLQEILQKGIPVHQVVVFQNLDKGLQEMSKQFLGMEMLSQIGSSSSESQQIQPGRALLEMIKAESNPQQSVDHYLLALQILLKDGMQSSAQKLISYLRRKGGFPEQGHAYLLGEQLRRDIVNVMPQKEERLPTHLWYVFFALACFGALVGLGFDWLASLFVGLSIGIVIFVFGFVMKK